MWDPPGPNPWVPHWHVDSTEPPRKLTALSVISWIVCHFFLFLLVQFCQNAYFNNCLKGLDFALIDHFIIVFFTISFCSLFYYSLSHTFFGLTLLPLLVFILTSLCNAYLINIQFSLFSKVCIENAHFLYTLTYPTDFDI